MKPWKIGFILVAGVLLVTHSGIGIAGVGITDDGHTVYTTDPSPYLPPVPSRGQEKRDQERHEWERQDRAKDKAAAEQAAKAEKDSNTEAAYAKSQKERQGKVARLRGKKSKSWQLNH